ncbi:hypothetical protein E8E13_010738 [Curvularia kusanoi]|uniref:C2H2-type domain-containing protein n=1 Tax=Curvularia kusanoi TaxID=90978 RepID=A0A9P4WCK8_CURKU|nr:hypothetical protein E8E13_010738 [Curvularia kusanoi]
MPAIVDPNQVKCTVPSCDLHFATVKEMKRHKRDNDDEDHEYCYECDEDFECEDDLIQHKVTRPDKHDKACRVCGQEFKSDSGLKRHIEKSHKVPQKLACIGCGDTFYRACLFIEHLEYGHCKVISAPQFQGHIIHKHLITALLKDGNAYARFQAKQARYEAAHGDFEEEGGVCLTTDALEADEQIEDVKYAALRPDVSNKVSPDLHSPYPPLPSRARASYNVDEVASTIDTMSISHDDNSDTFVGSQQAASTYGGSQYATSTASGRQLKVWSQNDGKSASNTLFPNAKPTPVSKEFSIAAHDEQMERDHGINIMSTRFWDPQSPDWNPERFYDSVLGKYNCPFVCERTWGTSAELNAHIRIDHRLGRTKCPACLKYFNSSTALMTHCESRGSKCQINKCDDFNLFLDRLSGGFLAVSEETRPDHINNPSVMITNPNTGRVERYTPPRASYLQYKVTTPPDWKEPAKVTQVGTPIKRSQW